MNYTNEVCQRCGNTFNDNDDIVVCPVCGTPQHRACWNEHSQCINSEKHSPDFTWEPQLKEPETTEPKPIDKQQSTQTLNPFQGGISSAVNDTEQFENLLLGDNFKIKDEEFDSIKVSEAALYLQSGNRSYIKKFRNQKDKRFNLSWNWGAFFFAPAWFFYRKLYKFGFLFLAICVAVTLFTTSYANELYDIANESMAAMSQALKSNDTAQYYQLLESKEFIIQRNALAKGAAILSLLTFVLPNGISALVANSLVKNKMKRDINKIHAQTTDPQISKMLIMQKGGTSPFVFFAIFFISPYIAPFLMSIAQWFIDVF